VAGDGVAIVVPDPLVPFRDAQAIAVAVVDLLRDEPLRHSMRKNAYKLGRDMVWNRVARLYVKSFEQARREPSAHVAGHAGHKDEFRFGHNVTDYKRQVVKGLES